MKNVSILTHVRINNDNNCYFATLKIADKK